MKLETENKLFLWLGAMQVAGWVLLLVGADPAMCACVFACSIVGLIVLKACGG